VCSIQLRASSSVYGCGKRLRSESQILLLFACRELDAASLCRCACHVRPRTSSSIETSYKCPDRNISIQSQYDAILPGCDLFCHLFDDLASKTFKEADPGKSWAQAALDDAAVESGLGPNSSADARRRVG
jgi:hypothetical protein